MITKYHIPRPEQELPEIEQYVPPECSHYFVVARQDCANGSIQYKHQCTLCGTAGPAIPHAQLTKEEKDSARKYDPYLATRVDQEQRQIWKAQHPIKLYHISDTPWYKSYMKSDVWREKSERVITRARLVCEACGIRAATQAHHLDYDHVGEEPLYDLVAVCKECHEQIHGRNF